MNKNMKTIREETRQKIERLSQLGFNVVEMWECAWTKKILTEKRIHDFVSKLDIVIPLDPRDAFFGGRTNAIKLHHKVEGEQQIHYKDMISLYPCANLNCLIPWVTLNFRINPPQQTSRSTMGWWNVECYRPTNSTIPCCPTGWNPNCCFPCVAPVLRNSWRNTFRHVLKSVLIPQNSVPLLVRGPLSNWRQP